MIYLVGIIPSLIILTYIYKKDVIKEPIPYLIRGFILGTFIVFPAGLLEGMIYDYFHLGQGLINTIIYSFLVIALIEEGLKYFFFMFTVWNVIEEFDEIYDGIIYTAFISLGFATFENILYIIEYGQSVGYVRAFTAVPLHGVAAIIMGTYLGKSKFAPTRFKKMINLFLGILIPVLVHGLYDFIILLDIQLLKVVVFPLLLLAYYSIGYGLIGKMSGK